MKNWEYLLLFLLLVLQIGHAQMPFPVNRYGEVTDNSIEKLAQKRGYELVSAFDTVSKKPVLVYAQYFKNGNLGILDIYGREITPAIYDKIEGLDRSITPNLFSYPLNYVVKEKGKYGLISNTGKKLIASTYKHLSHRSRDSLHFTAYQDDGTEFIVNANGKKVTLPPEKDPFEAQNAARKPETTLSPDGKSYHLHHNWSGKETDVPNLGTVVQNYGNTVVFMDAEKKTGLYDVVQKRTVIPFEYDEIQLGLKGYYKVRQGKFNGVLDSVGQQKVPLIYESIAFTSGGALAYVNKKYRIYDLKFNKLTDLEFDRYSYMGHKGLILVRDGKYGLVSTDGKILAPFEYDMMETPEDHDLKFTIILARKNGEYAVMDFNGKLYTDFIYDTILPESLVFSDSHSLDPVFNGYANQPNLFYYVKVGNKWGLIDNDFKPMIEPVYDYFLESYDRTVLFAKMGGKWGMIDLKTERPIIPFIYDGPLKWMQGTYQVYQNNAYGLVNRDGKILLPIAERAPINVEKIYNGLWRISNYAERTSYYVDYAGRKTAPKKWN
jgi:hypothetical protein